MFRAANEDLVARDRRRRIDAFADRIDADHFEFRSIVNHHRRAASARQENVTIGRHRRSVRRADFGQANGLKVRGKRNKKENKKGPPIKFFNETAARAAGARCEE